MTLINCLEKIVVCNDEVYNPVKIDSLVPRDGIGLIVDFRSWHSNRSRTDIFTPDPYQKTEKDGRILCQRLLQHI